MHSQRRFGLAGWVVWLLAACHAPGGPSGVAGDDAVGNGDRGPDSPVGGELAGDDRGDELADGGEADGDASAGDAPAGDPGVDPHRDDPGYAHHWCQRWQAGLEPSGYQPVPPQSDPHAAFYAGVVGLTGDALRAGLKNLIDDHTIWISEDARHYMLQELDCHNGWLTGVYTGMRLQTQCGLPDGNVMNTEHTWPKSRMTGTDRNEGSQTDLHHLFPTQARANSVRGDLLFGHPLFQLEELYADLDHPEIPCGSRKGLDAQSRVLFESRISHKGDVARAIFYYAVRYERSVESYEEAALRCWNALDPPDATEWARQDVIASDVVQGVHNRNPFIDHPEWVEAIDDF